MKLPAAIVTVFNRVLRDGFIHAGNIAYLSLTTLFPTFILFAAIAATFGRTEAGLEAVNGFLATLPPDVGRFIGPAIEGVLQTRTSGVFTFGAIVALWTVTGFIETLREVIRRPYGVAPHRAAWLSRLFAALMAVGFVVLVLFALFAQVLFTGAARLVGTVIPVAADMAGLIQLGRIVPVAVLFVALWALFHLLTPKEVRARVRSWPGALATMVVWVGSTLLLPPILGLTGGMAATYGALAGVMVALLFFYVVGLGFVAGAEINGALARRRNPEMRPDDD